MDGRVVLVLHGLILVRRTAKGLCWAEEADVTERIGTPLWAWRAVEGCVVQVRGTGAEGNLGPWNGTAPDAYGTTFETTWTWT